MLFFIVALGIKQGLARHVQSIRVCGLADRACLSENDTYKAEDFKTTQSTEIDDSYWWMGTGRKASLPFWQVQPIVHVYHCKEQGAKRTIASRANDAEESFNVQNDVRESSEDEAGEIVSDVVRPETFAISEIPAAEMDELWESIVLESHIKCYLLEYISSGCLFSQRAVDTKLVSWNRMALLHGPPGTGKTSLSRALAHKLSIRLDTKNAKLIEIHADSIFSKWFSESSRNVANLFKTVRQIATSSDFVVVLIDEVESLSASRNVNGCASEPSDSLRAVNALLTALDTLRSWPNVLVVATSNLTDQIDSAFLDRADIKQFIGPPALGARYEILRSGLNELIRCRIVLGIPAEERSAGSEGSSKDVHPHRMHSPSRPLMKDSLRSSSHPDTDDGNTMLRKISLEDPTASNGIQGAELQLFECAKATSGLSGRTLRKLCLLAHAAFVGNTSCAVPLHHFLVALKSAAIAEGRSRRCLGRSNSN